MELILDCFVNWSFDKIMDYILIAGLYFVFKSKSKQNYPDHFEEKRRHRN
ncbi:hypothetical protein P4V37_05455 [Bacillus subtilis]|uniref:SPbeta prophage-derived uncharacterized protein YoqT n=4 Tax=root TaxID=1 RepID=YOQT_BACSU|nr:MULTISPECIES: hypothetical protein [Bacillales]NP_046667.1 hypothetical protein SPBc2p115 [Bacillus phage SPBc2]NP_389934.1 conserved hypothetical protein; phage SPbeta [Bacillus subtilis subsp. subtilis str. 168]O31919.1 RecName: Full=SPbeta prophage-derived uncharacterized protein YoqT [Bacillus subtilis subsp. subtilis str. 168]UAW07947.1 hypothetical protein [Bacillus phage BUCT082]AAC13088.1 hypothetical protein [Bacillus phage SPBc2]AFQ57994.1 YoqT [Bacillus subtilis QB928]AGG61440.